VSIYQRSRHIVICVFLEPKGGTNIAASTNVCSFHGQEADVGCNMTCVYCEAILELVERPGASGKCGWGEGRVWLKGEKVCLSWSKCEDWLQGDALKYIMDILHGESKDEDEVDRVNQGGSTRGYTSEATAAP
jgi:hypothetical protein